MKIFLRLIIFFIVGIVTAKSGFSQAINFQFRDTLGVVNTFIDIPVRATTTFTGRGILSYVLQFSFSSSILNAQGVVTTGTVSAAFGTPTVNTSVPGVITIAGAGGTALTGLGNFMYLRFKIVGAGSVSIVNTGIANNYLNEGNPLLTFQNSCYFTGISLPVIAVTPNMPVMLKGATQQFAASSGTGPYTWSSTNTGVATVSATGLLTATQIGFASAQAVDANTYTGLSNNIEVRGYSLSIPDTTGAYNTNISIPVRTSNLSGLNVLSGTININFNQNQLTEIQIETTGALLQTMPAPTVNLTTAGSIQLSFAGTTPLSGAGVLFWIKCKLSNVSGGNSGLIFQTAFLNEGLLPITKNGYIIYSAPPGINIAPNSGQLVYGDSLRLTVSSGAALPFIWSVSDTNVAIITSAGDLKVKRAGQVRVSVTDANSASATTGIFQLYDTYLKISDTAALPGAAIDLPIKIKVLPDGQSIFSIEGKIFTANPAVFSITEIVTAGTPMSSFSLSSVLGSNYISFAIAGVTAVPGNAILFKIKGIVNSLAPVGSVATLSFQDILINEGTPLPFLQTGTVTVAVPAIYRFTGNGNWNVSSNWLNNLIPPALLQGTDEIIIDPLVNGECILNIEQRLLTGTKLTLISGKKLRILSNLTIK